MSISTDTGAIHLALTRYSARTTHLLPAFLPLRSAYTVKQASMLLFVAFLPSPPNFCLSSSSRTLRIEQLPSTDRSSSPRWVSGNMRALVIFTLVTASLLLTSPESALLSAWVSCAGTVLVLATCGSADVKVNGSRPAYAPAVHASVSTYYNARRNPPFSISIW